MSKLKTATRDHLPDSAFALPGRRFPIHDEAHARAALQMAHNVTPSEQATIRRKVHAKYPQIDSGHEMSAGANAARYMGMGAK
jgi:hypothetical protein